MMNNDTTLKPRKLFEYLSAYHELLTIITLFGSGIVWTAGYFATKSEVRDIQITSERQVERLHCLLRLNIEWLAGEQLWKIANDDLTRIEQDVRIITPVTSVPDVANLQRIVELERQRDERKKDIDIARVQKNESRSRLMQGDCGQ
jgi:hypothetical protein